MNAFDTAIVILMVFIFGAAAGHYQSKAWKEKDATRSESVQQERTTCQNDTP